jgi:hypothetical protein
MKILVHSLALAATLGLAAAPAAAQSGSEGAAPAQEAMSVSDAKLESFVAAADRVRDVMAEYRPQLEAAETDAERKEIEEAVNGYIVEALEATDGITVQEYVQIARAARQDQELYNRIVAMMEGS